MIPLADLVPHGDRQGRPNKQGGHNVHGSPLGKDEIAAAREYLGWTPRRSRFLRNLADWRATGDAGRDLRAEWDARLAAPQGAN
jgi:transketolase